MKKSITEELKNIILLNYSQTSNLNLFDSKASLFKICID